VSDVPPPGRRPLAAQYEDVRYEAGQWPLWRWDRNLRYIAKSLLHKPFPSTEGDRAHWQAARDYLASKRWQRTAARRARLVAGGDLMWIRAGWSTSMSDGVRRVLDRADAAVVNLETPMVPERPVPRLTYETLHYNAPTAYLDAWRATRPRVVSLANNHALDQGRDGLARTREVVDAMGFVTLGGPRPEHAVAGFEAGGLRVGAAAFTYGINRLEGPAPEGIPVISLGVAEPDWGAVGRLLGRARAAGGDLVVVVAHWSFEYEYWPDALARAHARRLVELGADVVIGSSPHVLQPVEVVSVDGADARCPTQATRGGAPSFALVAWSLGNLSSIMPTLPCRVGALLDVTVGRDASGVVFEDLSAVATVCGRGLGDHWLDARTLTLDEYARGHDARPHRGHAERILGPLLTETR
jgi:hypothetical protein